MDERTRLGLVQNIADVLQIALRPHVKKGITSDVFWVHPLSDRVIISVDPLAIKSLDAVTSKRFSHLLSTSLHNRMVVLTNTIGVFFQISFDPRPPTILQSVPLDLSQQPTPLSVPIGMTKTGPLWLSITDIETALIAGSRGMGKSRFLHTWIQALIYGSEIDLFLWDGKHNAEFGRYGQAAHVNKEIDKVLRELTETMSKRAELIANAGFASITDYNVKRSPLKRIVLIIDEAAEVPSGECQDMLKTIIATGRAWGVHVVIATQRTGVTEVSALVKANMITRISFSVPEMSNSQVILGRPGAEKLPKHPGLMLFEWGGRLRRAQAFRVELPEMPGITDGPSQKEIEVFQAAQNGRLSIPILQGMGWTSYQARSALNDWQRKGWVVPGKDNARYVSPDILSVISQGSRDPQTPQASYF